MKFNNIYFNKKNFINYFSISIISILICISLYYRFDDISNHFTHIDDISYAKTIYDTRSISLKNNIFDKSNPSYNSSFKKNIRYYVNDQDSIVYKFLDYLYPYVIGTLLNTSPPIHSILINIFLPDSSTYEEIKFL